MRGGLNSPYSIALNFPLSKRYALLRGRATCLAKRGGFLANIVKVFGEQKSEKAKFFCEQTVLTNRKKLSYSVGYLGLI